MALRGHPFLPGFEEGVRGATAARADPRKGVSHGGSPAQNGPESKPIRTLLATINNNDNKNNASNPNPGAHYVAKSAAAPGPDLATQVAPAGPAPSPSSPSDAVRSAHFASVMAALSRRGSKNRQGGHARAAGGSRSGVAAAAAAAAFASISPGSGGRSSPRRGAKDKDKKSKSSWNAAKAVRLLLYVLSDNRPAPASGGVPDPLRSAA